MSAAIAAMVTAVVGVLGTLFAPVVTTWTTKRQRAVELRAERERQRFEELRASYTAVNRASRHFHTLLEDALHRIRDDVYTDDDRALLEAARRDHRDRYAEAQMIVPEAVLDASRAVNTVPAAADAAVKRNDRGPSGGSGAVEQALVELKTAEPRLTAMRRIMREDLGVVD
jgi:type II secretory pathway pseudopilin PulG